MDNMLWIGLVFGVAVVITAIGVIIDYYTKTKKCEEKEDIEVLEDLEEDLMEQKEEKVESQKNVRLTESTLNFTSKQQNLEEKQVFAETENKSSVSPKISLTESNLNFPKIQSSKSLENEEEIEILEEVQVSKLNEDEIL